MPAAATTTITAAAFVSSKLVIITLLQWYVSVVSAATSVATTAATTTTTTTTAGSSTGNNNLGQQSISAVMGESAVVDKETGRIFWEGGSSNTLIESIAPKLRSMIGIPHIKATILTVLLLLVVAGTVSQFVREWLQSFTQIVIVDIDRIDPTIIGRRTPIRKFPTTLVSMTTYALILLPKSPRWFILLVVTLYLMEAYTCSTHKYLLHIVDDAETYIEHLREQLPIVEWRVRSFHFENYYTAILRIPFQKLRHLLQSSLSVKASNESIPILQNTPLTFPSIFHWKRVTHSATGYYNYTYCTDQTIVGVWKRAPIIMNYNPPTQPPPQPTSPTSTTTTISYPKKNSDTLLDNSTAPITTTRNTVGTIIIPVTKMVITKTLLLRDTKTRHDYFTQQQAFLRHEHADACAEFSTKVYMNNTNNTNTKNGSMTTTTQSSRILALLPSKSVLHQDNNSNNNSTWSLSHHHRRQRWLVHRYTFWFCTCIGFTVPYRRWLASQCDEVRVRIVKETSMG